MSSTKRTSYRVIATYLDAGEIAEADRIAETLREAGWPRATRSLVIREALERLREDLRNKSPEEVFRYFIDRRGRRAAESSSQPRSLGQQH